MERLEHNPVVIHSSLFRGLSPKRARRRFCFFFVCFFVSSPFSHVPFFFSSSSTSQPGTSTRVRRRRRVFHCGLPPTTLPSPTPPTQVYLFTTHCCEPLSQHKAADSRQGKAFFSTVTAILPPRPRLSAVEPLPVRRPLPGLPSAPPGSWAFADVSCRVISVLGGLTGEGVGSGSTERRLSPASDRWLAVCGAAQGLRAGAE